MIRCIVFFFCCSFFLYGQTGVSSVGIAPGMGVVGLEQPVVGEKYVLMPGDILLVTITGPTTYAYSSTILPEGKFVIWVPVTTAVSPQTGMIEPKYDYAGAVSIWGLTIREAEKELEKAYRKYFKRPKVIITLTTLRQFIVFVVGEVNRPGVTYALPITRVSELIDSAGGLTPLGTRSHIKVIRADSTIIADLDLFESKGELSANPVVKDGDIVLVPPMSKKIVVRGAIFGRGEYELKTSELTAEMERYSEGIYELLPGERISDIIRKAGGVAPWADLRAAYIERQIYDSIEKINVDIEKAYSEDSLFNLLLKDGDILVVPSLKSDVYVGGQVVQPGPYEYRPNFTARDYIGMAGGVTDVANLKGTSIKRGRDKLSYSPDLIVEAGDVVHVPRVVLKFWQDYLQIGQVISTILLSWLTYNAVSK